MDECTSRRQEEEEEERPRRHETVTLIHVFRNYPHFGGRFEGDASGTLRVFYFKHLFDDDYHYHQTEDIFLIRTQMFALHQRIVCEILEEGTIMIPRFREQPVPCYVVRLVCAEDIERFIFYANKIRATLEGRHTVGQEETKYEHIS